VLEQNQRTREQQLKSLRLISRGQPSSPTVAGMIAIGYSPRDFVPSAYVQFLRLDGVTLADPIKSQHEIAGPLPTVIRQLDELLQINITTSSTIVGVEREVRAADYPLAALQQIARNAIMHRTYEGTNAPVRVYWFSDRIEVMNPGGPFGQVTRANIGQPGVTDYRNPHLAEVMKNLGYVQRFGAGFEIARRELAKNGNPPLEIVAEDTHVAVILRRRPE
jgi:ATP-dependent DNA helicase RecG